MNGVWHDGQFVLASTLESRAEQDRQAFRYAERLAIAIHAKHYAEVTQWRPVDDVLGLLIQIDNMTSGLVKPNV